MLDSAGLSSLLQIDAGAPGHGSHVSRGVRQGKLALLTPQEDRAHIRFRQGQQLRLPIAALHPNGQLRENLVILVDPSVFVLVVLGQLPEAVSGFGPEEFAAVVDFPVAVFVEGQEAAGRVQTGNLLLFPVSVQVEVKVEVGQGGVKGVQIDNQGVRIDLCFAGDLLCLRNAAGHFNGDDEVQRQSVGGDSGAGGGKLGVLLPVDKAGFLHLPYPGAVDRLERLEDNAFFRQVHALRLDAEKGQILPVPFRDRRGAELEGPVLSRILIQETPAA